MEVFCTHEDLRTALRFASSNPRHDLSLALIQESGFEATLLNRHPLAEAVRLLDRGDAGIHSDGPIDIKGDPCQTVDPERRLGEQFNGPRAIGGKDVIPIL